MWGTALRAWVGPVVPLSATVVGPQPSWGESERLSAQGSGAPVPPGSVVVSSTSATTAVLRWSPVEGNSGYRVERAAGNGGFTIVGTVGLNETSFGDAGLMADVTYRYRVSTLMGSQVSEPSPVVSVTPVVATDLAAPTGLSAERPSATQVRLSWEGTDATMAVLIQRSLDGGLTWGNLATVSGASAGYTDPVQRNTLYSYRLRASTFGATSPFTGSVSVLTPPGDVASLLRTAVGTTTAELTWTAVQGATGYVIEQSREGGAFETVATIPGGVTRTTITGLDPGTQHRYRIRATNAGGGSNPTVLNGVLTVSSAPRGLVAEQVSAAAVRLSFEPVKGAASYVIERQGDGRAFARLTTLSGAVTTYTDVQVVLGEGYEYRVKAVNESGDSAYSEVVRVELTASGALPTPEGLTVEAGAKSTAVLRWRLEDNGTAVSGFVIQQQVRQQWRSVGAALGSAREFAVRGLGPGQTARLRVLPSAGGVLGRPSEEILAVGVPAATGPLRHLVPPTDRAVTLTWSAPRGAATYTIERSVDRVNWEVLAGGFPVAAYVDETVEAGAGYFYRVFASNGGGSGLPSPAFSVLTVSGTPSNVRARAAEAPGRRAEAPGRRAEAPGRGTVVTWDDVAGETAYRVQGSTDGVRWSNVATTRRDATVAVVRDRRLMFFRVASANRAGTSPYSGPVGLTGPEATRDWEEAPGPMTAVFSTTAVRAGDEVADGAGRGVPG